MDILHEFECVSTVLSITDVNLSVIALFHLKNVLVSDIVLFEIIMIIQKIKRILLLIILCCHSVEFALIFFQKGKVKR